VAVAVPLLSAEASPVPPFSVEAASVPALPELSDVLLPLPHAARLNTIHAASINETNFFFIVIFPPIKIE
jgi:hypothetical protein